ncbi:ion channel [Chromohalobacter nigrandesensis]|uniref:ion channel n=1 Tax=Chromohalobacter nigrandesensis TaxID=119863 RepID=UPI001FF2476E|nr:ion channel [Chromohalobacter nigrandesensis]MCK0745461.1 ion channel [Chromohalobacter nigrandesensis]
MSASIFKIEGQRVDSQDEFARFEEENSWHDLLYYPENFQSTGRHPIVFSEKVFERISFKDTDFRNIRFLRCQFKNCLFAGASFTDCEFIDCRFFETNTSKLRVTRCLLDPSDFKENFDLFSDTNIAIGLYQTLYKNASDEHQPEHAIESLYNMERARHAHLDSQKKRDVITRWEYLKGKIRHRVYDFVTGYGLRPLRVVRLLFIVVGLFSVLNFLFDSFIFGVKSDLSFVDSIYFTVVSITTLGFGDMVPVTAAGRVFVTFQALFGFVAISLFLSAIVNIALRSR